MERYINRSSTLPRRSSFPSVIHSDMDTKARVKHVAVLIGKLIGLLSLLYIFVCSLDVMSSAFRLVGGKFLLMFE